jgi:hypothetical protein
MSHTKIYCENGPITRRQPGMGRFMSNPNQARHHPSSHVQTRRTFLIVASSPRRPPLVTRVAEPSVRLKNHRGMRHLSNESAAVWLTRIA